jgi:hypothetical protein
MPEPINFSEAGLQRSQIRKPTDRLISNPLFGLSAIRTNKRNRFDIRTRLLQTMSFMSLQLRQHESTQILDDGTTNFCHPLASILAMQ